jgi:hypothetical protein
MTTQTPFNIFPDKLLRHGFLMRFKVTLQRLGNQRVKITYPTTINHILRLLPELLWYFRM